MIYNVNGLTDTFSVVSGLEDGLKHYWRVWGDAGDYQGPKSEVWNFTPQQTTGVQLSGEALESFSLAQNYPNPFNPSTVITYSIPKVDILSPANMANPVEAQHVTLIIYDILGNEITTLVNERKPTGRYEVIFDAAGFVSGIYFYKLQSGFFSETKKMLLIR
jgi:hypothetical protein